MAAWTAGFDLANLVPDLERSCLILEVAVSRRFRYGAYRRSADSDAEARSWQEAKQAARWAALLLLAGGKTMANFTVCPMEFFAFSCGTGHRRVVCSCAKQSMLLPCQLCEDFNGAQVSMLVKTS